MKSKTRKDILVVSFALFSMFFGAGNVIFPPLLGLLSGKHWFLAGIGFIITGAGLPILAMIAMSKVGSLENLAKRVNKYFPLIIGVCTMISIGPLLAIPKTAALTYEIGIKTLLPNSTILVSTILFFIVTLIFSLNRNNVLDKLGTILTPLLIITLLTLIIKGVFFPISKPVDPFTMKNFFAGGFIEGYQTMDLLAAIMFAMIIINGIKQKGYEGNDVTKLSSFAGIFAGLGLAIVYAGMIYIGACTSGLGIQPDIPRSELLLLLSTKVLGVYGKLAISIVISLACLTTAVGLTATAGQYFSGITQNKLKYHWIVIFTCVFSCIIANAGVDKIIKFSAPILSALYPVVIVLVLLALFNVKNSVIHKATAIPTLVFGTISALPFESCQYFTHMLPLGANFPWLIPAVIGLVIGYIILFIGSTSSFGKKNKALRK